MGPSEALKYNPEKNEKKTVEPGEGRSEKTFSGEINIDDKSVKKDLSSGEKVLIDVDAEGPGVVEIDQEGRENPAIIAELNNYKSVLRGLIIRENKARRKGASAMSMLSKVIMDTKKEFDIYVNNLSPQEKHKYNKLIKKIRDIS